MTMHNGHKVWYAVCYDREDNDHGTGSFDKKEALRMARDLRNDGYPEAYVVVVDPDDDFALDEITDF